MILDLPRIPLEDWLRVYYFDAEFDLGSSGVQCYSFPEFCELTGFSLEDMQGVVFDDSETFGAPKLRQLIADRWDNGNPEHVLVGNGSNEIGFLLMMAMLNPGDEVIAMDPIYHTMDKLPEAIGCKLKPWPIRFENGWQPDFDQLEAMVTPNTRMICVNFPHNPTGISLTPEQQRRLIDIAASVNAYLVWDAAFEELTHQGDPLPSPRKFYDRAISVYTMSKCFGLPGSRIGWALCPLEVFENLEILRDYTTLYVSPMLEAVGIKAVQHADKLLAGRIGQVRTNLALLTQWIEQHPQYVSWVPPMGGVTGFVRLEQEPDAEAFCRDLAKAEGVMMVPGSSFKHARHVRLGFGGPVDRFSEGLDRVTRFFKTRG